MSQTERAGFLGLGSGIGLVAANMIGAGVFLSAGFMAQEMGPGWILIDWVVGMILAMAGARAYAELAMMMPRSGGEYRYLADVRTRFSATWPGGHRFWSASPRRLRSTRSAPRCS